MLHWYVQQRVASSCTPYKNLSPILDAKSWIVLGHCQVSRCWAVCLTSKLQPPPLCPNSAMFAL